MRKLALAAILLSAVLSGCASDEEYQAQQRAGGSLPWNRPESWEGAGALGSQMNQYNR